MRAKLRQIGNLKGVILKKSILKKIKLSQSQEFEIKATNGSIVLTPHRSHLDEFANFFKENQNLEISEKLLLDDVANEFEKKN